MRGCGAWPRSGQLRLGGLGGGEVDVLKLVVCGLVRPISHCLALRDVSKLLLQAAARIMFLQRQAVRVCVTPDDVDSINL